MTVAAYVPAHRPKRRPAVRRRVAVVLDDPLRRYAACTVPHAASEVSWEGARGRVETLLEGSLSFGPFNICISDAVPPGESLLVSPSWNVAASKVSASVIYRAIRLTTERMR